MGDIPYARGHGVLFPGAPQDLELAPALAA